MHRAALAVVLQIAAAQVGPVLSAPQLISTVVPVFIAFLLTAAGLAKLPAHWMALPADQGRTPACPTGNRQRS